MEEPRAEDGENVPVPVDDAAVEPVDGEEAEDEGGGGFFSASHGLTSMQKMSVLLVALGPERSKAIISGFSDEEIERIAKEIARMRSISTEQREAVLQEAYEYIFGEDPSVQGRLMAGRGTAKMILNEAVGGVRARNILDRLDIPQTDTFLFVGDNDLENLAYFLQNQLPQIAAVTILHLRPEHAQRVLEMLPPKLKAEVVSRMVAIEKVDKQWVGMLKETLQEQLKLSNELVNLHGDQGASSLLKRIPGASQEAVLTAIGETDQELRGRIERQLTTFDDLAAMDDRNLQLVLNRARSSDKDMLPIALRSCSENMRAKLFAAMTSTIREEVEYRLQVMAPRRLSEIEEAQYMFVEIAKQLNEEGTIIFGGTETVI